MCGSPHAALGSNQPQARGNSYRMQVSGSGHEGAVAGPSARCPARIRAPLACRRLQLPSTRRWCASKCRNIAVMVWMICDARQQAARARLFCMLAASEQHVIGDWGTWGNRLLAPQAKPPRCRKQRSSATQASCWASAGHARCGGIRHMQRCWMDRLDDPSINGRQGDRCLMLHLP